MGDVGKEVAMSVIDISPLTWEALLCCFLSGIIIGLERQLRGKPVGMRTSALICLGTYVFIAISTACGQPGHGPLPHHRPGDYRDRLSRRRRHSGPAWSHHRRHFGLGHLGLGGDRRRDRARISLAGRQAGPPDGGDPRGGGPCREPLRVPPARRPSQSQCPAQAPAGPTLAARPGTRNSLVEPVSPA